MSYAKKILVSAITLMGVFGGQAAWAEGEMVRISAAQLETTTGAEKVYINIYDAAKRDCADQFVSEHTVKTKVRYQRCLRLNVKTMVGQVGHPNLDQVYINAKNGSVKTVKHARVAN